MRILTFNWHEGYIHLLARTGYEFDVVERWKGGRYGWIKEFRPVPPNCRLISEEEAKARLESGSYDRAIAHNLQDFTLISESPIPKVLLHHNKIQIETNIFDKEKQGELLRKLRHIYSGTKDLTLVFISKAKRESWGLDGEVILPTTDPSDYGGYVGNIERVLRIGNFIKERDMMLGYSIQERILKDLSSTTLGLNPNIPGACLPENWEDFKDFLRSHRVYLHTTTTPNEDGYNLSMLEVMATGAPVVSIANPTSPIEDGVNGFVSDDEDYLREKIKELLKDRSLAKSIGQKTRETVMDKFPVDNFIKEWKRVIEGSSHSSTIAVKGQGEGYSRQKRLKIVMSYTSNPLTTAFYIEKALRKHYDVITYGSTITVEILKMWNLEGIRGLVKDHDIPYFTPDISTALSRLPSGWEPDIFLWVESGVWDPMEGFQKLPCLTACYLIDTHLGIDRRVEWARNFDIVFIAQKADIVRFRESGIKNVFWLPLACDPEIHGKKSDKKLYEIGFVGSLNNPHRVDLLNMLKQKFDVYYERCFFERMAEVFSQSKIVFNNSVKDDLNMRVFEAMASGSMLLTDESRGSGLTGLFEDRKHLVIYRNEDELFELVDYYMENDKERENIAEAGMKEVVAKHTYEHRVEEMMDIITSFKDRGKTVLDNHPEAVEIKSDIMHPVEITNKDYFRRERREVEALIPEGVKRVLDVGCGEGVLGRRLLEKGIEEVVGIEINPEVCEKARHNISHVICGDIEKIELPFDKGYFDCCIIADVLEHLKDPLNNLNKLKQYLSDSAIVVASIPNVRYYGVINMLVEGYWKYEDYGILDKTHLRFFTKKEIEKLFVDAGFEITGISVNIDPQYYTIDLLLQNISFGRVTLKNLTPDELKDLFVIQYLIRAQKSGYKDIEFSSLKEAKKRLEDYLETHPADLDMLCKYAEVCYMLGFKDKAIESLERVLIFEPDRKDAIKLKEKIGD